MVARAFPRSVRYGLASIRFGLSLRIMNQSPTFSVVIPTFNCAEYIVDAVDSVLSQTDKDFEILVIDDGSVDNTSALLEPYKDRIRYIHQQNRGMAAARNHGIREAVGEYVALLDSDDLWDCRLLATVRSTFERHPDACAAFIAEREIDSSGELRSQRVYTKRSRGLWFSPEGMIGKDTRVGSGRPPVVRRALLDEHGVYDEDLCGAWDCDLWIRYSFYAPMVLMPEPLLRRRVHEGNFSDNQLLDAEAWLTILDRVVRDHPQFVQQHAWMFRRTRAKNHLRVGRELLARSAEDPALVPRARHNLRRAVLGFPFFLRGWTYLAWSLIAPHTFSTWRTRQLSRR